MNFQNVVFNIVAVFGCGSSIIIIVVDARRALKGHLCVELSNSGSGSKRLESSFAFVTGTTFLVEKGTRSDDLHYSTLLDKSHNTDDNNGWTMMALD